MVAHASSDKVFYAAESKASMVHLVKTGFVPPRSDLIEAARRRQAKRERRLKRFISILLGWGLFVYMVYLIVTTEGVASKIWDPYEVLGISSVWPCSFIVDFIC